jgi:7,8-dihydroneopterin aldolase/epimerase/oxygenase
VNDRISIRGLRVATRVGVTAEERARPQTVVIDADIGADLERAAASDDLSDTIDYGAAVAAIADVVSSAEVNLLEHLAGRVVTVLSRMDGAQDVAVEIAKDPPPVQQDVAAIAVRIVGAKK